MAVAASVMVADSTVDAALPAVRLAASTEVVDFMATPEVSTAEAVDSTAAVASMVGVEVASMVGVEAASMVAVADTDNRLGR